MYFSHVRNSVVTSNQSKKSFASFLGRLAAFYRRFLLTRYFFRNKKKRQIKSQKRRICTHIPNDSVPISCCSSRKVPAHFLFLLFMTSYRSSWRHFPLKVCKSADMWRSVFLLSLARLFFLVFYYSFFFWTLLCSLSLFSPFLFYSLLRTTSTNAHRRVFYSSWRHFPLKECQSADM